MDIRKTNSRATVCLFGVDRESRILGRSKADWMRKHLGDVKVLGCDAFEGPDQAESFFRTAGAGTGELYRWGLRGCSEVVLLWAELVNLHREHLGELLELFRSSGQGVLRFQCGAVGRLEALAEGELGRFVRLARACFAPHMAQPTQSEAALRREILGRLYRSGVRILSEETLDVDDVSSVGQGTELCRDVTLRSSVVGQGCRLESCRIERSSLSHGCIVNGGSVESSAVGSDARILDSSVYGCTVDRGVRLSGGSFRQSVLGAGSQIMAEGSLTRVCLGERCRLGMCNELSGGVTLGAGVWSACGVRISGERSVEAGEFLN